MFNNNAFLVGKGGSNRW